MTKGVFVYVQSPLKGAEWWVSCLIQATISSLNKQHIKDRLANTVWIQHVINVFATRKLPIMKSFQSGNIEKKSIHWIWISQQNLFDGDSPYSFKDLFARVYSLVRHTCVTYTSALQPNQNVKQTTADFKMECHKQLFLLLLRIRRVSCL